MIENDKQSFYKNYNHDLDIEKIILNLDVKKEKCCMWMVKSTLCYDL